MSNPLSSFIAILKQAIGITAHHEQVAFADAERHLADAMKAEVDAVEARIEAKFEAWKLNLITSVEARLNGSAEKAQSPAA